MADPTTILVYAELRSEAAKNAVTAAQQRLAEAQAAISAKRDELATATRTFADLEKTAAEIRKKLGVIPTPVDGPKLLQDLEQVIIGSRGRQAAILKAGSDLRAAQSDADQAQAELAAASASRAKADSDLLQAKQSESLRKGWKDALTAPPLVKINDDAVKELTLEPFTKAKTRVESELPNTLRDRATERRTAQADRLARALDSVQLAEDLLIKEREKTGAAGQVENARIRLLRAEAAAKDFTNNARSRFDRAKTLLTQVAESSFRPTDEQTKALEDPDLKEARTEAAAAEKELDGKRKAVEIAQAALDQARLDAIVDPAKQVASAEKDLTDAEDKLSTAEASYSPNVLDAWEAAAPDTTWRLLDDFEKAKAALTLLSKSHPDTLASDLVDAEKDYVAALLVADASAALITQLAAEQARRAARQQSALQAESNSLFSALRGDN
ncbi:MAG: hypothetical protein AABN34_02325 [Acidobacteriota bacterium]